MYLRLMDTMRVRYALYVFFAVYVIALTVAILNLSQGVGWDPALNMKMADNAGKNIPFNYLSHPKPANLSQDDLEFVAWWTPGQYALPMIVRNLLNIKISAAIKIVTAISLLLSGWGIFKLFGLLLKPKNEGDEKLSTNLILILVLFTLLQPFFWRSLFDYDGGVVLLNAYCPWFFYGVAKIKRVTIYSLAILLMAGFAGFFLKAAFTSIFAGALFYLFLQHFIGPAMRPKKVSVQKIALTALYLGMVLLVYLVVIKTVFLNHNTNISNSSLGVRLQPRALVYPIDAPVLGLFSVLFLNKTIQWIIAFLLVIPVYYLIFSNKKLRLQHRLMLVAFVPATVLFYMLLYFINVDVSYELRHFIPITVLITPAFFMGIAQLPYGKILMYGIICLYTGVNIYQLIDKFKSAPPEGASILYSGLYSSYPSKFIETIHTLDNQNKQGKDIFYLQSGDPTLALEIKNNRVLLEDNFINFHFYNAPRFKPTLYFGRNTAELYVVYSYANFKKDSTKFLTRFEKYKHFQKLYQDKGFVILKGMPSGN